MAKQSDRVPPTKTEPTVRIPRSLADNTMQVLLSTRVADTYLLVKAWDEAVPGLIQPKSDLPTSQELTP